MSLETCLNECECRAVDDALRDAQPTIVQPLQHLRRFVRFQHLPAHLKGQSREPLTGQVADRLINWEEDEGLYMLICATTDLALDRVQDLLAPDGLPLREGLGPLVSSITVPALPPTSEAQARQWSQDYWPTIYKKHNPFGAHPAIISKTVTEIEENVDESMELARKVGRESSDAGIGESIGAVVVNRSEAGKPIIVVVSGDARWSLAEEHREQESRHGNVMAHAVMRAIGLIARKRRDVSSRPPATEYDIKEDAFADHPMTPLELMTYNESSIEPGGYLCLDLEFYLTHEPCVMCSMALLHSRVGRVIFERQMIFTGGLVAGVDEYRAKDARGLDYGLFWRPKLNWKFLTWQWTCAEGAPSRSIEKMHA